MSKGDDSIVVLVVSLVALAAVVAWAVVTGGDGGMEPIPLPTTPVTLDE